MIRHCLTAATCLLLARIFYLASIHSPDPWQLVFRLTALVLGLGGGGWGLIKLIDWWGEEAPISHPRHPWHWSRMTYREAMARFKLIELFDGDARLARRQVRILMARYPGKPEQWCWEQAIVEIEGDR
jgi:hypothetical protein